MRNALLQALGAGVPVFQPSTVGNQKPLKNGASNPFTKEFGRLVTQNLERWHVPGLAMAVVDGDNTWSEGYGIATFPTIPVTPDTLFYGASTTKAFVAGALSIAIESGNFTELSPPPAASLSWRTPLSAILRDDFVLQDPWATAHLTLEDALSHRTGLSGHDRALSRKYGGRPARVRDVTRNLRHLPLNQEPRTTFQYNNLMFAVLSHAVETLTGRWLGDVLKEWIWAPLGMRSTYFDLQQAHDAPEDFARGYFWDNKTGQYIEVPFMPLEEVSGAGAVVSTVNDYAKWLRCLLHQTKPLSKAGIEAIKTPKIFTSSEAGPYDTPLAYASGWFTSSYKGHRFWTHSGGMHAYGAEVYFFPDEKFGIATFGNTAGTSNAAEQVLAWHLIDEKLGIPKDKRFNWGGYYEKALAELATVWDTALDTLYPDRADPPLDKALPLESYTGIYFNSGYQNLSLTLEQSSDTKKAPKLVAEFVDASWPTTCEIKHVSGEHWLAYCEMTAQGFRDYAGARTEVGPDGKVAAVVVDLRGVNDGNSEGSIRFDKIS